jgi:hypothetical protein
MSINAIYLSFSGDSEFSGISKKKMAQVKGLKECGCNVVNCYYSVNPRNGHRKWMVDDEVLIDLGTGAWAKVRKRIDYRPLLAYILENRVSFVYMRSDHNANPFLIHFVKQLKKKKVAVVMEIPTYPYDQEYITFESKCHLFIDKLFRGKLAKQLHAIVTFSGEEVIFGQRTIRISNGVDFSSLKLKEKKPTNGELHLIGVAEIHYWHGFDRVLAGMADYYKGEPNECNVFFHIVGEFSGEREKNEILPFIKGNRLENYVTLHGRLFGADLDSLFDKADMGVGSLGRHRSNITHIKTLKNREYAARGVPFFYSEIDEDFENMAYILKIPADESPVDIKKVIDFYSRVEETPQEIRDSVKHLSWNNQMQIVLANSTRQIKTDSL